MPVRLPPDLKRDLDDYLAAALASGGEPPPELTAQLAAARRVPFRDALLALIRGSGHIDSEVYAAAGIDRRHYSKIRNDPEYRPDKITVVSLAFALGLGLHDAEKLLRSAGFALSPASVFDLICRYFFENAPADPDRVNDALWTYRQPLVCGVRLD